MCVHMCVCVSVDVECICVYICMGRCLCVCMCVLYVNICVWVCLYTPAQRPEKDLRYLVPSHSTLFPLKQDLSLHRELGWWPASARDPPVSHITQHQG